MGNVYSLDCCVGRFQKEGDMENATDYFNKCLPPVPMRPKKATEATGCCCLREDLDQCTVAVSSGVLIPPDPSENSMCKTDVRGPSSQAAPDGATETQELHETPRFLPEYYLPTTKIPNDSTTLPPSNETLTPEADNEASEEMDKMPSPPFAPPPVANREASGEMVQHYSLTSLFNSPEAPEAAPFEDGKAAEVKDKSTQGPLLYNLSLWYTDSSAHNFTEEQKSPSECEAPVKGEAGRESATGATLFYNMSINFTESIDASLRPGLGKFGSFVMSQPAPAFPPTRGATSNSSQDA
eukprot:CAMPEP_0172937476 /NCGR_PEP_ID=MMETSP1075-20121228/222542_1 /TAXON_ID=2916 /ORGANISM="Ceratium fusus, Strain PA161109" /LENGTH=295 /DNA_ID=CAMNT_0013798851 /DNA_START=53 /DNA_END=940 /DNA_ORIENTATION=+